MTELNTISSNTKVALLGFSIVMMESLINANYDFVAVVLPDAEYYMKEYNIPYVIWDFGQINEKSVDLYNQLKAMNVDVAVPLYEETVEWAGALNSRFCDDPRLFNRYFLFRDKAMMKRKAQISGIRVGVFEEAENLEDTRRFFKRVNQALLKLEGEEQAIVHLKPTSAAGCVGHKLIQSEASIEALEPDDFPCLLETHLDGQEFSCEVFIHNGKIRFLNITEYIRLGHTNFIPASPELESKRPLIEKAVQDLIDAFGIEYGMIHPEFFITPTDSISFGEVAARIPGGHIFDLIGKAYGFNPYVGFAMCCNPKTTEAELEAFFPAPATDRKQYSGCVMVYPKHKSVISTNIPDALLHDPYYEKHDLFVPVNAKVAERAGFGNHYGTIYFNGDDPEIMRERLIEYDNFDFYVSADQQIEAHV